MPSVPTQRRSITDSPWFWVYLYCTFGLILLVLWQSKFQTRQAEIERQYQGRERMLESQSGQDPITPVSTSDSTIIGLQPLYIILGAILIAAWIHLWWRYLRPGSRERAEQRKG